MSDRWQRIEELYHAALSRKGDERAAYVAEACGADADLQREVVSLLEQSDSKGHAFATGGGVAAAVAAASAAAQAALIGRRIGVYQLQTLLGVGGMGEVYRARDTKLGRDVAIKILPELFTSDPQRVARFEREAKMLAAVNHPNIGAIYGIEQAEGIRALVLELVDGGLLADRIASGPLPLKEALAIARQIADALDAAHERGIVHRDLKPRNIGLTRDGIVKVLDFGLAKPAATDTGQPRGAGPPDLTHSGTQEGVVVGTAAYMSPEQARGRPVDKRTDIWAFGCVLYEMLAGRQAFAGATYTDIVVAVIEHEPDWTAIPTTTPPNISRLLERCLAKETKHRLRDIGDARLELDEALGPQRPVTEIDLPEPVNRRWRLFAIAAAVMVPAAVAAALWLAQAAPPSFEQLTFRRARIGGARFVSGGAAVVYSEASQGDALEVSRLDFADSPLSRSLNYPARSDVLAARTGEVALSLNRRFVIGERFVGTLAIAPLGGGTPRETDENIEEADWNASGTQMAVVRASDGLTQSSIEFPAGRVLYKTNHSIRFLRVSPDGQRLAFAEEALARGAGGHIAVVDLNGNVTALTRDWDSVRGLAWSAATNEIWYAAGAARSNRALRAVTLDRRERIVLDAPGSLTLWDIAPDGRALLSRDEERRAVLVVRPGESVERDLSWFDDSGLVEISNDGKYVLGGDRGFVFLRATDGSPPTQLLKNALADDISPDGKAVLATIEDGRTLVIVPTGAGSPQRLPKPDVFDVYRGSQWFPDGRHVLFTASEVGKASRSYVQDINGGLPTPLTPEDTRGLAISQAGDMVAVVGGQPQEMSIWPMAGGTPRPVRGARPDDRPVSWTPDGRSLWMFRRGEVPAPVFQLDLTTGERRLWKNLVPPDAAGVYSIQEFRITPNGDAYAYGYSRLLSQLYLVRGLK
jgi:eukaryotic-like serine/threonine-protein kinase